MILIGIVIGIVIGIGVSFLINKKKNPLSMEQKYSRTGFYESEYTNINNLGEKTVFTMQFELGEISRTSSKSKVRVISCTANMSKMNTESNRVSVSDMVNDSWIDSDKIDWISNLEKERDEKLSQILKK